MFFSLWVFPVWNPGGTKVSPIGRNVLFCRFVGRCRMSFFYRKELCLADWFDESVPPVYPSFCLLLWILCIGRRKSRISGIRTPKLRSSGLFLPRVSALFYRSILCGNWWSMHRTLWKHALNGCLSIRTVRTNRSMRYVLRKGDWWWECLVRTERSRIVV